MCYLRHMARRPGDDLVELFPPLPFARRFKAVPPPKRVVPAASPKIPLPRGLTIGEVKSQPLRKLRAAKPPPRRRS